MEGVEWGDGSGGFGGDDGWGDCVRWLRLGWEDGGRWGGLFFFRVKLTGFQSVPCLHWKGGWLVVAFIVL